MTTKKIIILGSVTLLVSGLIGSYLWERVAFNTASEANISTESSKNTVIANLTTNQNKSNNNDDLNNLANQVNSLKIQMAEMKETLLELGRQNGNSTIEDVSNQYGIKRLVNGISLDPSKLAKIQAYRDKIAVNNELIVNDYFDGLDDSDPVWSVESETYFADKIASGDHSITGAEVLESKCKSGVCKVEITFPENTYNKDDLEPWMVEHKLLISLSEKFPNSRLKNVEAGGRTIIQAYFTDGSVKLPRDFGVLNDSRLTVDEINSIVN